MDIDVIVVGAGPAGSTAAREIAARRRSVLLLDCAQFPRDKPCGGAVGVRCAALLPFDLTPVVEDVVTGAILGDPRTGMVTRDGSGEPLSFMTQRRRLDAFLVEHAQEAGAEFRDGQAVRDVVERPDGTFEVRVGGAASAGGEVLHVRVLIGADGANGVVGTALGFAHPPESAVALEGNLPCPQGVPRWLRGRVALSLALLPGGYGWLFPKGDHINVGVGGWKAPTGPRLRETLDAYTRSFSWDPADLRAVRGHHLPLQRQGMTLAVRAAALVGDAAGLVDPLSGEGIYGAIASAVVVAPAVDGYLAGTTRDLAGYQQALALGLLPELERSRTLAEIFHAWPRPLTWAAMHSERSWRVMTTLISGGPAPAGLAALTGLLGPTLEPAAWVARRVLTHRYPARS